MLQNLNIRKELFWDVDYSQLDENKNQRLIIERVMNLGNQQELFDAINYYGKTKVGDTLKNLNYLDPKTLNFSSLVFEIPKTEFKCYIRKQSTTQHWT
jgi:hypothetical protein